MQTTPNPVGAVTKVPGLDDLVAQMKQAWDTTTAQLGKVNWHPAVMFLAKCLDDLILYLVEHDIPGADKKATVLAAFGRLYDYVVTPLLPIWVRPFAGQIRSFTIDVMASAAIDWIVEHYQNGAWRQPPVTTQPAQ